MLLNFLRHFRAILRRLLCKLISWACSSQCTIMTLWITRKNIINVVHNLGRNGGRPSPKHIHFPQICNNQAIASPPARPGLALSCFSTSRASSELIFLLFSSGPLSRLIFTFIWTLHLDFVNHKNQAAHKKTFLTFFSDLHRRLIMSRAQNSSSSVHASVRSEPNVLQFRLKSAKRVKLVSR